MADDPRLAALCLADCPMSNPAALSSLCSLCSVQRFCSLLCILMASSSLQDCIALSQGSTTASVAALRFPASPARTRAAAASAAQHRLLPRTQKHRGELSSTLAQPARKTCGACFQTPGRQLTLLQEEPRYHQAGPQQHLLREVYLPNPSQR